MVSFRDNQQKPLLLAAICHYIDQDVTETVIR